VAPTFQLAHNVPLGRPKSTYSWPLIKLLLAFCWTLTVFDSELDVLFDEDTKTIPVREFVVVLVRAVMVMVFLSDVTKSQLSFVETVNVPSVVTVMTSEPPSATNERLSDDNVRNLPSLGRYGFHSSNALSAQAVIATKKTVISMFKLRFMIMNLL
jgi:hypothetical protein